MTTPGAEATRRWKAANPDHYRRLQREYVQRKYDDLIAPEKAKPCVDCGETFSPERMHFDHVRGEKLFSLARFRLYSRDKIKAEIAKCEIRCTSCHTKRHNPPKTHCIHGHEYTAENTYVRPSGSRECRTCMRTQKRKSYHRAKATPE